ncbi:hypothetical protein QBC32DRAFT_369313 [Pseudoneurospora amorphoporcata]|uniref:Uncharacterized protein n=1 Tax=Pseudoneurospora amorphoporcata TaxID=241081 RepID=A0AAN6P0Z0_9PEZI|nr:hypothetical protein QBC32DRAFT_369313 [Pseudoneurospora amorphoporcata]
MTGNRQIRPGMRNTTCRSFPDKTDLSCFGMDECSVMHKSGHASRTLNVSSHAFANHFIAKKLLLPTLSPCQKDYHSQAHTRAVRRDQMGSV